MKRESQAAPGGFDEHERDTAQRAYPKEIVDNTRDEHQATTRIARFELEKVLQKASGTRPAVTSEEIERLARDRKARAEEAKARVIISEAPPSIPETPSVIVATTEEAIEAPSFAESFAEEEIAPRKESRFAALPRWFFPVAVLSVGVLVTAALAAGFVLGRMSTMP